MDENVTISAPSDDPRVVRTHAAVMAAAEHLLLDGGPTAVTYSALAEVSGVGRATLYRHWPTMGDLWTELSAMAAQRMAVDLAGDLRTDLKTALTVIAERMLSEVDRMNFLTMLQRSQYDPDMRGFADALRTSTPVHQALRRAIADGELPEELDIAAAASFLLGPLMHRGIMERIPIDAEFIDEVIDRYLLRP